MSPRSERLQPERFQTERPRPEKLRIEGPRPERFRTERPLTATYRLQLTARFRLADAAALLADLDDLGVSHLYLSPLLRARAGSAHGYDVVDPTEIDPARGSEADLARLAEAAHARGTGLVLDVVPNHLAASEEGPAWRDVLARGEASPYARWFDVDFAAADGRVVLPVLGAPLAEVLARGELALDAAGPEPVLAYFERRFPLAPETHAQAAELGAERGTTGGDLAPLLARQHYELVFWRESDRRLNYRRFFDVDELACVRVEDPAVFAATHERVLAWVAVGWLDGLRVDHVDGLRLPAAYLRRLRHALDAAAPTARRPTLHVEKILARDERLPAAWPVDGTTGYEFLADAGDLFVDPEGYRAIQADWRARTHSPPPTEIVLRGKREALTTLLAADLRRLVDAAERAVASDPAAPPAARARASLSAALVASIVHLAVYRTYLEEDLGAAPEDAERIAAACAAARAELAGAAGDARTARDVRTATGAAETEGAAGALDWLERVLLRPRRPVDAAERELVLRWQQVSGPATAKGVEDTAFYRYTPLASRSEVGADPARPPHGAAERFHAASAERLARWPRCLLALSTHDTKRSADVRARLDALTADPDGWRAALARFEELARPLTTVADGERLPDAATRDLVFQTLCGVWPPGSEPLDPAPLASRRSRARLAALRERVAAAMQKSAREAKRRTSWLDPDPRFEAALAGFVEGVLDPERSAELWAELDRFARPLARAGRRIALARLVLQLTAPGVPDVYQGELLWRHSLVDPDNRRPVDFALRRALRAELAATALTPAELATRLARGSLGRVKLHVARVLLRARRADPETWLAGAYEPLAARGPLAERILAYRRGAGAASRCVLVLLAPITPPQGAASEGAGEADAAWTATAVRLPAELGERARCLLTGRELALAAEPDGARSVSAGEAFAALPAAVLAPAGRRPPAGESAHR